MPLRPFGEVMCFGLPPATISARCECMYAIAGNCFVRSGVMKMPLITTSQRCAPRAGRSPEKDGEDEGRLAAHLRRERVGEVDVEAGRLSARVEFSIGGNVGLSQYLNDVPVAA